jgi:hypothetical protein
VHIFQVRLNPDQKKELKECADEIGISQSEFARIAIHRYIERMLTIQELTIKGKIPPTEQQ